MDPHRLDMLCEASPFVTGPEATTDLHAGGIFFCVLYQRELTFHSNRDVSLNYRILDNWRPLDDEVQCLSSRSKRGKASVDSKGNLTIAFPDMTFTGAECDNLPGHIAFYVHGKIQYPDNVAELMAGDMDSFPDDFTESVVFSSSKG